MKPGLKKSQSEQKPEVQREEPILQTYVRAEGLLGSRSNPNPAICNLSRERFEAGSGTPETTMESSIAPQISTEPKPKKRVRFAEPVEAEALAAKHMEL